MSPEQEAEELVPFGLPGLEAISRDPEFVKPPVEPTGADGIDDTDDPWEPLD